MTILRALHDKEHPFVMVARGVAQETTLSYEALGLLTYLLSKPDDWTVVPESLTRKGCGRDKVYKLLNELKDAGYIAHERIEAARNKPPMWGERIVVEAPIPEKPEMAAEQAVKPAEPLPFPDLPDTANAGYGERQIRQNGANKQETKDNKQENKQREQRAPAREASPPITGLDRNFMERRLYYSAFEMAFPEQARVKVPDKDKNHAVAQFLYGNGYDPLEVTELVREKLNAGRTDYRFEYLEEDMGKRRLEKMRPLAPTAPTAPTPNGNGKHAPSSHSDGILGLKQKQQAAKLGGK